MKPASVSHCDSCCDAPFNHVFSCVSPDFSGASIMQDAMKGYSTSDPPRRTELNKEQMFVPKKN